MKSTTPYRQRRIFSKAYLRWKEQLEALKGGEIMTVKRLAREASDILALKKGRSIQLSIV